MILKGDCLIKKLLAGLIAFLLVFSSLLSILENVSFATDDPNANIEVNGYFSGDGFDNTNSLICDVNNQTVKLNFDVSVKGEGYFKSGVLTFPDDLNFVLNPSEDMVIKDNKLKLPEVNNSSNLKVSIPISFEPKDNFKLADLYNKNTILFKGEYVDNEGILYTIEKELIFDLTWTEITESKIEYEVIKNLDFEKDGENGKIFQIKMKLFSDTENKLPIRSTKILVDIPQSEGLVFSDATVDVDKLSYTQAREDFDTDFTKANYKIEDGKIVIDVGHYERNGEIGKGIGEDSYILTFIYNGKIIKDEEINSKISASISNYGDKSEDIECDVKYKLYETTDIGIQYLRENKMRPISKGYLMANSNQEKYEIDYSKKDILSVSRSDLVSGLIISDVDEYFVDESGENAYTANGMSYYKKTEFSKENLVSVLGESGKIEILNVNDEVIGTVECSMDADENGLLSVEYSENISNIKIKFSDPISDGNISVVNTKGIKRIDYSIDEIKSFDRLVSHAQGVAVYNEGISTDLGIVESNLEISKTSSGATIELENPELLTTVLNEGVNFKLRLNNNDDISDLYGNPVFEVRLPEVIKEVNIKNIDMFYANGELEIANVENFLDGANQVIRITLSGRQFSYDLNKETNGTVISLDVDLILDELAVSGSGNVELYYYNELATRYDNEVDWLIAVENDTGRILKNGSSKFEIFYKGPTGLVNAQATETVSDANNEENVEASNDSENLIEDTKVISTKQGAQSDLLSEGEDAKLATMYITIMNNTERSYSNFKILGRIPFIGNKDVLTGEDLGTTVDTILNTEIAGINVDNYVVYYSENPNATEDLNDVNNNWQTDFYKTGAVKSYLIVFPDSYVLEKNTKLEFQYDYVIPANLKSGDAFYGTYATYFTEGSTQISSKDSADKIGYETLKNTNLEASISLASNKVKELSTVKYNISLKNVTDIDAKNVEIKINKPINFLYNGISENDFSVEPNSEYIKVIIEKCSGNCELNFSVYFDVLKNDKAEDVVNINGVVSASNIEKEIDIQAEGIELERTDLIIEDEMNTEIDRVVGSRYEEDYFVIKNVSGANYTDVRITKNLDSHFKYVESIVLKNVGANNGDFNVREIYDEESNIIEWEIEEFPVNARIYVKYYYEIEKPDNIESENIAKNITMYSFNGKEEEFTKEDSVSYYQPEFNIINVNKTEIGYSKAGENLTVKYEIENKTDTDLSNVIFFPKVKNGDAYITTETLKVNDKETEATVNNSEGIMSSFVPANTNITLIVNVNVREEAADLINLDLEVKYGDIYKISSNTYTYMEQKDSEYRQITGSVYVDKNKNQALDYDEYVLSGVVCKLYDSVTNKLVGTTISDIAGRYMFRVGNSGNYFVEFSYDDEKYLVSTEKKSNSYNTKNPLMKKDSNCITDNLNVNDCSFSNVDLPLSKDVFDMKVNTTIDKIIVQNIAENTEFNYKDTKLAKTDIAPELIDGSKVLIEYKIEVMNQGSVTGKVSELLDYLPEDVEFDSSLNPDWYRDVNGNLYTRTLRNKEIEPGKTEELRLVLIRNMTENNTGLIHNSVEISSAINDFGMSDIDSKPNNKLDEDDLSYADVIVGISTGNIKTIVPVILVSIIVIIPLGFGIWKIIDKRRYV